MLLECGDLALVTPTDKISELQPFRLVCWERGERREESGGRNGGRAGSTGVRRVPKTHEQ